MSALFLRQMGGPAHVSRWPGPPASICRSNRSGMWCLQYIYLNHAWTIILLNSSIPYGLFSINECLGHHFALARPRRNWLTRRTLWVQRSGGDSEWHTSKQSTLCSCIKGDVFNIGVYTVLSIVYYKCIGSGLLKRSSGTYGWISCPSLPV